MFWEKSFLGSDTNIILNGSLEKEKVKIFLDLSMQFVGSVLHTESQRIKNKNNDKNQIKENMRDTGLSNCIPLKWT